MHSDFFAAHFVTNHLEDIHDDLRIKLKATPPYLHCPNGYAKVYMRVLKVDTYTRLLQAVGTPMGDDCIAGATDLWWFSMEQSKLTNISESLTTTKKVTGAYVNREQIFYEHLLDFVLFLVLVCGAYWNGVVWRRTTTPQGLAAVRCDYGLLPLRFHQGTIRLVLRPT